MDWSQWMAIGIAGPVVFLSFIVCSQLPNETPR